MVKLRLIPVLYIKNGLIVRSEGFSEHKLIGNVINEAHRYNQWDIDELIYIDISREGFYDLRRDDLKIDSYTSISEIIKKISKVCFMPLTFGGQIRTMEDIDLRIKNGADKITLNTAVYLTPELVSKASKKYGAQCVVISIDYKMMDGKAMVFVKNGEKNTGVELVEWIQKCEQLGAGEIFLNAIDRDGKANGYGYKEIKEAVECTNLPIVACGGAGDFYDFVDLAEEVPVSGIAAGNIFHFTERSYPRVKKLMKKNNLNVR